MVRKLYNKPRYSWPEATATLTSSRIVRGVMFDKEISCF
jgi:hypothetical protein